MAIGAGLGVHHLLQHCLIAKDEARTFYLEQLFLLEIRKKSADGLPRGANHLGDLFMGESELDLSLAVGLPLFWIPRKQQFRELLCWGSRKPQRADFLVRSVIVEGSTVPQLAVRLPHAREESGVKHRAV